jgi:hypothetical protein
MERWEKTAEVAVALVAAMMEQILMGLVVAEKVVLKRLRLVQVAFLEATAKQFSCSHPHALLSIVNSLLASVETVLLEELVETEEARQEIPMQVVMLVMVLLVEIVELAVAVLVA